MLHIDAIRKQVAENMSPDAPLAIALTNTANALEVQLRGLEAVIERVETLEEQVLPREVDVP
jgi:hypothetical protein